MPCSATAAATPSASASASASTRCSGARPARVSPPGTTRCWAQAAPAGTSSARRSRSGTSDTRSTSRAAAATSCSRTTSAVQALALTGGDVFARHYVHQAMVGYQGEKMSKSKGNLVLVSRLRAQGVDPMAIRLVLLDQHYRTEWEYTPALLEAAVTRLARWREALSVN